jgi:hypothetical protein
MTTQTIHLHTYDYGASLTSATLRTVADDTLVATADSVNEVTADSGLYAAVFGEASVIAAGEYRLRAVVSGKPLNRYVTLAGTDGEVVEARSERLAVLDSAVATQITAIETFATRMTTGLVVDGAVYQFTANMLELGPSGGGGGDATLAKQAEILAAIQGSEVIQVASPNVSGNLVLTQGDDYDGVANPKASWTVTTDYTSGWTVRLTIRSAADAVIYTNTGSVVSSTVVAVTIAAPTGLTMTGCPGQWQGKFDVELTHSSGKKKTIALGTCYINEDQTR